MYKNPVYKRELTTENRSLRFHIILILFYLLLVVFGLIGLYLFASKAEQTGVVDYSAMLKLYAAIITAEFILIITYIPIPAGVSVSGERETHQFDLLIMTALTPGQIVLGKLRAILSTSILLCMMGMPVLSLVFIYGGIRTTDILLFLGVLTVEIVYIASTGIFISSLFHKSITAVFVNYFFLFLSNVLGLFFLFSPHFGFSAYLKTDSLYTYYPLLLTPAAAFYELVSGQMGRPYGIFHAINSHELYTHTVVTENWLMISMGLHIVISILALYLATDRIRPKNYVK